MNVSELNRSFSIDERLLFEAGVNGFPKAVLRHESGATLEVYPHGAHVTSFRSPQLGEVLYMSPKAEFQAGKAIRGGIPLIFPQFGPGALPSHGFARGMTWQVNSTALGSKNEIEIEFNLSANEDTRKVWPFEFKCEYQVRLTASLATTLRVTNTGRAQFPFQCALHSYYQIGDIGTAKVHNLEGLTFLDNTRQKAEGKETRKVISIDSEVDRVYLLSPAQITLEDPTLGRKVIIQKQNLRDAVVWNPWIEKGKTLKDMPEEDYKKFVCIEAGTISPPFELAPGECFEGVQEVWIQAG